MTAAQDHLLRWRVEPREGADLTEQERTQCMEITASYGGRGSLRQDFRRYRTAEICARTIRVSLGVETTIAPRRRG